MGWGFARKSDKRPELERLAAEAEAIFVSLPPQTQSAIHETIAAIAHAAQGLQVLPDAMGAVLFKIVIRFFQERVSPVGRPTMRAQLDALVRGSPAMLGAYAEHLDTLATEAA